MKMKIHLYNTMTRQKEEFVPLKAGEVKLYSCGPTVYGDPHIGNMRMYFTVDLLKSVLQYVGEYDVDHVMNITDVGHLTDDGDQWEDKMEKWARREQKTVREVARMYEDNFKKYSLELQLVPPRDYTRATEYIDEQIDMIKVLIEKWYTYIIEDDGIYMDTSKVADYGKLAQLDFEGMNSEHRGDGAKIDSSKKKSLSDFALWKCSPKNEQRSMEWIFDGSRAWELITDDNRDSLTDEEMILRGFPGRHIECSAMATKELGEQIDIHTWWVDHVTVHHTNEIAQAECSIWCDADHPWVNRWVHGQFLNIDWGKVSKSKWDDLSIPWIIQKGYSPLDLRYFYLTANYRSFLDFSREAMDAAAKTRKNLIKKISKLLTKESIADFDDFVPMALYDELSACIADDLDTVSLLSKYHTWVSAWCEQAVDVLLFDQKVTKLWLFAWVKALMEQEDVQAPLAVRVLAEKRMEAKKNKERALADSLRDEIKAAWWEAKDTSNGYDLVPLSG